MNNSYIWWEQWLFELHEELWLFKRNRVYLSLTARSKAVSMQVPTVQGLTSEMGEIFATYESQKCWHKTFWIAALEPCTKARYTAN